MPNVEVSTSPRMTWIWCRDEAERDAVRGVLNAAGRRWEPGFQGRILEPLMTDVGTGVEALEAVQAVAATGYTFSWHADQHILNRQADLYGVPVADG